MSEKTMARALNLAEIPLFAGLSPGALQSLESLVRLTELGPGRIVVLEGDPCREVWLVAHGLLRVRQMSVEGREYVLAYLGPGAPLNLAPALTGGEALGSADTLSATTLYALPCERFRTLMAEHHALALAVAEQLARENGQLGEMVRNLALYSVRARLARFLLAHAEHAHSQQRWTQAAIAASIGTVRDVVGRSLRALADEGIIRRERGRLRVLDRERLEAAARDGE